MADLVTEDSGGHYRHSFWEFWQTLRANPGAMLGLALLGAFVALALLAPLVAPYDPGTIFPGKARLPPALFAAGEREFLLGTDAVGRDMLSRLLHGARISLGVGLAVTVFAGSLGTLLGLVAGYFGGIVEALIMRSMDIIMALPSILLAIVVVSVLGPGLANAVWAVGLISIPFFTRLVRAKVREEKKKPYVLASRSFGASHGRQMLVNIFPNCLSPLIVQSTLSFSNGILDMAALGFLGLGAMPPTAEWGTMLANAREFMESSPWATTLPGLCILLVVLGCNLLGDGLRDALDPRLQ